MVLRGGRRRSGKETTTDQFGADFKAPGLEELDDSSYYGFCRPLVFEASEDVLLLVQVYHVVGDTGEVGGIDLETSEDGVGGLAE